MKTPPESFLLFKEELRNAQLEKERLTKRYEEKLADVNRELSRLKEQKKLNKLPVEKLTPRLTTANF